MKLFCKPLVSAAAVAVFVAGFCCKAEKCEKCGNEKNASVKTIAAVPAEDVKLLLPDTIYATPGVETNIYFENIVRVINPANYIFEARGKKGRWDEKRWSFTPSDKDVGSFKIKINVIGNQGVLASKRVNVVVAPRTAGKGRNISILMVGDSLTAGTAYPRRMFQLFQTQDNPKVFMVGTHSGAGRPRANDGVIHEGYGGWTWCSFNTKWTEDKEFAKLTKPIDEIYARSPFLAKKEGKLVYDLKEYFDRKNNGKAPDIITFLLGINDIASANDENLEKRIAWVLENMDKLLTEMRKAAPDAVIGVGLTTGGATSQDAFGKSFGSRISRWQFKKNQHRLVEAMLHKFAKSNPNNIRLIPAYINLDCEHNFPSLVEPINSGNKKTVVRLSNSVHPSLDGYSQIGDTFFCWAKAMLAEQDKTSAKK